MTDLMLEQLGVLTLGSRLRRLTDDLYLQTDEIYRKIGLDFQTAWFPIIFLLADNEIMGVKEMAEQSRQTHSAISQMLSKLSAKGYVKRVDNEADRRRSDYRLTAAGEALVIKLQPVWGKIIDRLDAMLAKSRHDLLAAVENLENQLLPDGLTKHF